MSIFPFHGLQEHPSNRRKKNKNNKMNSANKEIIEIAC
jgi:hypothetical protein